MAGPSGTWSAWGQRSVFGMAQASRVPHLSVGWACHSRELSQLLGLAQTGCQSGYIFWAEVTFTHPEGRRQG